MDGKGAVGKWKIGTFVCRSGLHRARSSRSNGEHRLSQCAYSFGERVQNYRSSQNILDGSNAIIKHNQERLVGKVPNLNKDIVASNSEVSGIQKSLKVVEYPNTFQGNSEHYV